MAFAVDAYGYRYNDDIPSFVQVSEGVYYHRPGRKYLSKASVDARNTENEYTPGAKEIGASNEWAIAQLGVAAYEPPEPPEGQRSKKSSDKSDDTDEDNGVSKR